MFGDVGLGVVVGGCAMNTKFRAKIFIRRRFLQLTGLILIVTGAVIQGVYSQYLDFLGSSFFNAPVLLIVVGFVIFFITFFGCCGAIKENHCMTMTFSVLLAIVFLVELGCGIGAYSMKAEVESHDETLTQMK